METIEKERVRRNTSVKDNIKTDLKIIKNIEKYSKDHTTIENRLNKLEKEWDIERMLEFNAAFFSIAGFLMSARNRLWLAVPAIVVTFLAQHATQGWCPPLPLLRKLGFRTRQEIDREKYALKALRGDFESAWDANDAWWSAK
ncbi:MAG: hypothetical protein K0S32_3611 [Bacteroidetes bacterium]|jgi:hypothetical protein|nr:hypothetical protein [Bacteroidota bacterium]